MHFIAIPNYTPHRIAFGLSPSTLRLPLKGGVKFSTLLLWGFSTGAYMRPWFFCAHEKGRMYVGHICPTYTPNDPYEIVRPARVPDRHRGLSLRLPVGYISRNTKSGFLQQPRLASFSSNQTEFFFLRRHVDSEEPGLVLAQDVALVPLRDGGIAVALL